MLGPVAIVSLTPSRWLLNWSLTHSYGCSFSSTILFILVGKEDAIYSAQRKRRGSPESIYWQASMFGLFEVQVVIPISRAPEETKQSQRRRGGRHRRSPPSVHSPHRSFLFLFFFLFFRFIILLYLLPQPKSFGHGAKKPWPSLNFSTIREYRTIIKKNYDISKY